MLTAGLERAQDAGPSRRQASARPSTSRACARPPVDPDGADVRRDAKCEVAVAQRPLALLMAVASARSSCPATVSSTPAPCHNQQLPRARQAPAVVQYIRRGKKRASPSPRLADLPQQRAPSPRLYLCISCDTCPFDFGRCAADPQGAEALQLCCAQFIQTGQLRATVTPYIDPSNPTVSVHVHQLANS